MQILAGLSYLLEKRLLHLDIAARNTLLGSRNEVKIADFGMCRRLPESKASLVVKEIPGGEMWVSSALNSFVHVIMYTYYLLASLSSNSPNFRRKYLWWGRYLTTFQMLQFVIDGVVSPAPRRNATHARTHARTHVGEDGWVHLAPPEYIC